MSVYPYASVFLDDAAMLNGESTAYVERFYERIGFELHREWMVGAPDALGAELECMAWLVEQRDDKKALEFLSEYVLPWVPVCCLAVERNTHLEFYRTLARVTRNRIMAEGEGLGRLSNYVENRAEPEAEDKDLHWVVDRLTAPRRSGVFLSKTDLSDIGRVVQVPTGFGDRGVMLANLLRGAGVQERVPETLDALQDTIRQWMKIYAGWKVEYPRSTAMWSRWFERAEATDAMLSEMRNAALHFGVEKA